MYRVIDVADSGKTKHLMEKANQEKAFIVCKNPLSMARKATAYGYKDLGIINYADYLNLMSTKRAEGFNFYIDELESFMTTIFPGFAGYSMTLEGVNGF